MAAQHHWSNAEEVSSAIFWEGTIFSDIGLVQNEALTTVFALELENVHNQHFIEIHPTVLKIFQSGQK